VKLSITCALPVRCLFWLVTTMLLLRPVPAQAEVRSIQEFMTFQKSWDRFVPSKYLWQLEGRYSAINDDTLTFTNCPLPFRIHAELAQNRGSTGVVEVTGKIVAEEKGLAFRVEKLVSRPRDLEQLKSMRFGIDIQKPDDWYQLADWARGRGDFYNDKDLLAASVELDQNGILAELRKFKSGDEEGFAALIKKAREKKLDRSLLQQITHDELQSRFFNLRQHKFSEDSLNRLAEQIQKDLLMERKALPVFPVELNGRYEAGPAKMYAEASPAERQTLARLFLVQVQTDRILHGAREDGSNGFEIAEQFQANAPERADLIREYRNKAVSWQMARIATVTRAQLDEFTTKLIKLGQREQVVEAKRKWLSARETVFRQDGARGLADLAQLWISLLQDEPKAARLMIQAWQENPQYSPALEWLTAHGYRLKGQTWMTEAEIAQMPISPRELAIREGRLEIGMTASEVRSALGSLPTAMTRAVSRRQISEWWTYADAGILVQLAKKNHEEEGRVIRIEKLPGPSGKPDAAAPPLAPH